MTSFKSVVDTDVTVYCSDLRFTNDFILASFNNFFSVRMSDHNIKLDPIRSLLDGDKYGNFYAIEQYHSEYKIGIYSFDFEFLKLFKIIYAISVVLFPSASKKIQCLLYQRLIILVWPFSR